MYYNFFMVIYHLISVRQHFAIEIISEDQNHAIRLLQCNNTALLPNTNTDIEDCTETTDDSVKMHTSNVYALNY